MAIVSDPNRAWSVLKRLHNAVDGSFMFSNINDKFKIVIRNDPEGGVGHFMNVGVIVKVGEYDEILAECLDNVADAMGWVDEEKTEFCFAEFELDRRTPQEEDLKEFADFVNQIYKTTICHCAKHLISDGADMCYFCEFTSNPEKLATIDCPICMETCCEMHSVTMPCCKTKMHKMCDNEWYQKGNKSCAMCRADLPKRDVRTRITLENLVQNIAREVESRLGNEDDEDDDDDDEDDEEDDDIEVDL